MSTHPLMRPSDRVAFLTAIDPQSATTAKRTAWVSMGLFESILAQVGVGAISSTGTVDAKLQQATDSSGTGAKDITGKVITQLTQAAPNSNQQVMINLAAGDLDHANGFTFVSLLITPATAAALLWGTLHGFDCKFAVAHNATVVQVV